MPSKLSNHSVIEVEKLSKTYDEGQPNELKALKEVSFKVRPGDFVILFGPSGCGKSTLLHSLAGLEQVAQGEIKVRGQSLKKMSEEELSTYRRDKIGMVFQQFNLVKSLTVLQNVAFPRMLQGASARLRTTRAKSYLTRFGLAKTFNRRIQQLSGGQQQKVAIARALMNNPWILLVDEPTGNLDSKSAKEVMKIVVDLNRKSKRTVILVTHNPDYLALAQKVIYLKDGKIVKDIGQTKTNLSNENN